MHVNREIRTWSLVMRFQKACMLPPPVRRSSAPCSGIGITCSEVGISCSRKGLARVSWGAESWGKSFFIALFLFPPSVSGGGSVTSCSRNLASSYLAAGCPEQSFDNVLNNIMIDNGKTDCFSSLLNIFLHWATYLWKLEPGDAVVVVVVGSSGFCPKARVRKRTSTSLAISLQTIYYLK